MASVLTVSAVLHGARSEGLAVVTGQYSESRVVMDVVCHVKGAFTDYMEELTYYGRKRVHNLKYYTWVEQQGRSADELDALWYDYEGTWGSVHKQAKAIDQLINEFNQATGLL